MNQSESLKASLISMRDQNINFDLINLDHNGATSILQAQLLDKKVVNMRYLYGTLVLEFGILDEKGKWEYSIVCECDWKFQKDYHILCHWNTEKWDISKFIWLYREVELSNIFVIDATWEIYIGFWDIYFTTLSTHGTWIWWSMRINSQWKWDYNRSRISSDELWMYFIDIKKSTEI